MNRVSKADRILVTGCGGGLGSALKEALIQSGYTNLMCPSRHEMDLMSKESVVSYFEKNQPLAVFHFASLVFGLLGNLENQFRSVYENSEINSNLMYAISKSEVKYIFFAGTVASYPFPYASIPLKESEFFNGIPHGGEFGYAMAKRHAYAYLDVLRDIKGISYTYGILTNLYGENDRFNDHTGHVIPSLIVKAHKARINAGPFEVWGDGNAIRDFLHFKDAARAALFCMENGIEGLVNISSGVGASIKNVSSVIANAFGLSSVIYLSEKPVGIPERIVDNTKLNLKGFKPYINLELGLKTLCDWYSFNFDRIRS